MKKEPTYIYAIQFYVLMPRKNYLLIFFRLLLVELKSESVSHIIHSYPGTNWKEYFHIVLLYHWRSELAIIVHFGSIWMQYFFCSKFKILFLSNPSYTSHNFSFPKVMLTCPDVSIGYCCRNKLLRIWKLLKFGSEFTRNSVIYSIFDKNFKDIHKLLNNFLIIFFLFKLIV